MRHVATAILTVVLSITTAFSQTRTSTECDVLIVGGGAAGVSAATAAARHGATVVLAEPTPWLGGMLTAAGVSAIDGNYRLRAGFWGEFLDALVSHYGSEEALKTGWVSNVLYEPHVGEQILRNILANEPNAEVRLNSKLQAVARKGNRWVCDFAGDNSFRVKAKVLIDATELGDVAATLGVPCDIGMESRSITHENVAPEHANGIIQDLTYVAILKDYGTAQTPVKPEGYDPTRYQCCCVNEACTDPSEPDRMWSPEMMLSYGRLPGGKYMINWPIEGNDYYVNIIDSKESEREQLLELAKNHTLGFVYYMQTELGMNTLALADDEFPTADRLPLIPYHRESRRIHGLVRMQLQHITEPYNDSKLYRTAIAVGDYPVDHHHSRYDGEEELPNLYFHPVPSFGVPLGVMLPQGYRNLIVTEKSISVSNIVNGATRLQPVVMQLGTAAGIMAAQSVRQGCDVAEVSVREVQQAILDGKGYLLPLLDAEPTDEHFEAYQRIAATGILRTEGRNEGWSNQTWLHVDSVLTTDAIYCLDEMYGVKLAGKQSLTVAMMKTLAEEINRSAKVSNFESELTTAFEIIGKKPDEDRVLTRGEFAIIIDKIFNPFKNKPINITGNIK